LFITPTIVANGDSKTVVNAENFHGVGHCSTMADIGGRGTGTVQEMDQCFKVHVFW
jgi:hypothetical protein